MGFVNTVATQSYIACKQLICVHNTTILLCITSDIRVHTKHLVSPLHRLSLQQQKRMDEMIEEKQEPHYTGIE